MSRARGRSLAAGLLAAAALAVALLSAQPGGAQTSTCCICQCQGLATQCLAVGDEAACGPFVIGCEAAANASCRTGFLPNSTCAELAECTAPPAPAPSLDVTGLAAAIVVLAGLAALRLRRRPAKQRSRRT
jgi:MYXO-CTERM domain-containing protein